MNVLAPGIVDACGARRRIDAEPDHRERVQRHLLLGDLQRREDLARCVVALCGEEFSAMTGSVVLLDGGASVSTVQ